jgi:hypothetical protein
MTREKHEIQCRADNAEEWLKDHMKTQTAWPIAEALAFGSQGSSRVGCHSHWHFLGALE